MTTLKDLRNGWKLRCVDMAELLHVPEGSYKAYECGSRLVPTKVIELLHRWGFEVEAQQPRIIRSKTNYDAVRREANKGIEYMRNRQYRKAMTSFLAAADRLSVSMYSVSVVDWNMVRNTGQVNLVEEAK